MKLPSHAAIAGLILMAATQSPLAMELIVGAGETVVLNRDRILGANSSIAATGTLENNARLTNGLEDGVGKYCLGDLKPGEWKIL